MATIGWVPEYLQSGTVPNATAAAVPSTNGSSTPPRDPSQNEDCLFLDVMVPQGIFEKAGQGYGAPVLVWIYGKTLGTFHIRRLTYMFSRWRLCCRFQDEWL